ncbi:unnamed protein product, partial [Ectocarpus fasciculatus]
STLSVAAVTSLAGISADSLRTAAFGTSAGFRSSRGGSGGGGTGASSDLAPPPAVGPEPARLLTGAVSRVLHLHHDPRPFAGLCLAFAGDAA